MTPRAFVPLLTALAALSMAACGSSSTPPTASSNVATATSPTAAATPTPAPATATAHGDHHRVADRDVVRLVHRQLQRLLHADLDGDGFQPERQHHPLAGWHREPHRDGQRQHHRVRRGRLGGDHLQRDDLGQLDVRQLPGAGRGQRQLVRNPDVLSRPRVAARQADRPGVGNGSWSWPSRGRRAIPGAVGGTAATRQACAGGRTGGGDAAPPRGPVGANAPSYTDDARARGEEGTPPIRRR